MARYKRDARQFPSPANRAAKRYAPATRRNRGPLQAVLAGLLSGGQTVLEIACGSGEHAVCFASAFPNVRWTATDPDPDAMASAAAWAADANLPNLSLTPGFDAAAPAWPASVAALEPIHLMLCVNMIHIAPWEATAGLMRAAGAHLTPGGGLLLYGPFRRNGEHTAPSNASFDLWLKAKSPRFGVRDLETVAAESSRNGLDLAADIAMPANNACLLFRKAARRPSVTSEAKPL